MKRPHPATPNLLPRTVVRAIDAAKIIGVRAGTRSNHRFTGVWAVVVDGRVFVRSWTLKAGGWYRTLRDDPNAVIEVGGRQVRVRAVPARGARICRVRAPRTPCQSAASSLISSGSAGRCLLPFCLLENRPLYTISGRRCRCSRQHAERRTSNVERRTSNERSTENEARSTVLSSRD
jgi:hypothetical protein